MKKDLILETQNLTHAFGDGSLVVNDINLEVPTGAVYGFLGANGAGKTTTLKLILGLLKIQHGQVMVFNKPFGEHRLESLKNIGAMIESPSIYGHLTAIENLQILQHIYQCPASRIGEVLEMVGLAQTASKKAGRFSLGMKQRLSFAMALLHQPSLLILDEPTNGLDPNGMIEVRELLLSLNQQYGITIVISSHLLAEIERLVTHVGIIHQGSLVFQGTLKELQQQQSAEVRLFLSTDDHKKTALILDERQIQYSFTEEGISLQMMTTAAVAELIKILVLADVKVYRLYAAQNDLETIFMDLIANKNNL